MIKDAEITLYDENDDTFSFALSPIQLMTVLKILGIAPGAKPETISCFSDQMLQQLFKMRGNPLALEEKQ